MMRSILCRTAVVLLMTAMMTMAAWSQRVDSSEENLSCSAKSALGPETSIQVSLEGLGLFGEVEVELVALHKGESLLSESYRVHVESEASTLRAWLGGVAEADHLRDRKGDLIGDLAVEIRVDGVTLRTLSVAELLDESRRLEGAGSPLADFSMLSSEAIDATARGNTPAMDGAIGNVSAASTFQCPNAHPYCDNRYDGCESQCYMDEDCYTQCLDEYDECVYGDGFNFTTRVEQSSQFVETKCGWRPWYNVTGAKKWDLRNFTYLVSVFRRAHCETTGQTYDTFLSSHTETQRCARETPFNCGNFQLGSYINEDCYY